MLGIVIMALIWKTTNWTYFHFYLQLFYMTFAYELQKKSGLKTVLSCTLVKKKKNTCNFCSVVEPRVVIAECLCVCTAVVFIVFYDNHLRYWLRGALDLHFYFYMSVTGTKSWILQSWKNKILMFVHNDCFHLLNLSLRLEIESLIMSKDHICQCWF
jgi:hypothetical protein